MSLPSGVVLSSEELCGFATDGYIVLPGVVPEHVLAAADTEIDGVIAEGPPPPGTVGNHSYFLSPTRLPAAGAALRCSTGLQTAEELVWPHRLDHGLDHIQIALNIPPYKHYPGGPHLDGHRPEQDRPHSFSMLAAIFLCDESVPDSGNLWVWPGSHLAHQRLFAEQGVAALSPSAGTRSASISPRNSRIRTPSWPGEEICSWPISSSGTTPAAI